VVAHTKYKRQASILYGNTDFHRNDQMQLLVQGMSFEIFLTFIDKNRL